MAGIELCKFTHSVDLSIQHDQICVETSVNVLDTIGTYQTLFRYLIDPLNIMVDAMFTTVLRLRSRVFKRSPVSSFQFSGHVHRFWQRLFHVHIFYSQFIATCVISKSRNRYLLLLRKQKVDRCGDVFKKMSSKMQIF
jgi:hypothetical protein